MEATRSILFLHAGALGDFVLTLHVVAAVRARFPSAAVHMVARSSLAPWAVRRGLLDTAREPEACQLHRLYAEDEQTAGAVDLPRDVDRVISFLGGPDAAVTRGLRSIYGGRVIAIDPNPTPETLRSRTHITHQWLADIASGGIALEPPDESLFASSFRKRIGGPPDRVIVHPGSGGREKCCPLEVLEAAVTLLRERGCAVSWMIGPVETDVYGAEIIGKLRRTTPVMFEESVCKAADALVAADGFIGNDAGMSHLAAACGLRTVVLFGPTDPAVWRPLGPAVEVIQLDFSRCESKAKEHAQRIVNAVATR